MILVGKKALITGAAKELSCNRQRVSRSGSQLVLHYNKSIEPAETLQD